MKLLDLYCCGGGSAKGFNDMGFEVVGIDIEPQPKYPYTFIQADAIEYCSRYGHLFDAINASPPCQAFTPAALQWRVKGKQYPDLISATRAVIKTTGRPYILENVVGAPLIAPVVLAGYMFNMKINRTRLFECNFNVPQPPIEKQPQPVKMGRQVREGEVLTPVGHFANVKYAQQEMDIAWLGQKELAQAIPPAFTAYIAYYLLLHLSAQ